MKILVSIMLLLFVAFLAAPTIVSVIEDDTDISMVYSLAEEEIQKELKEIKAQSFTEVSFTFIIYTKKAANIKSENLQRHDNVSEEIFSPPPEII